MKEVCDLVADGYSQSTILGKPVKPPIRIEPE